MTPVSTSVRSQKFLSEIRCVDAPSSHSRQSHSVPSPSRNQSQCVIQRPFTAARTCEHERRQSTTCNGIGFELGVELDRGAEENAKKLHLAAYSVLLMHDVLMSKAGGAFLKVLMYLQKGGPEHLLSSYGEWFTEIAGSGHTSWQDHLLDEIISGRGNPLAKAAARGEAGSEKSMQQAAAYDLDVLQRLAITETTLAGWVSHVVSTPEGWLPAAAPSEGMRRREEGSVEEEPSMSDQGSRDWIGAPLTAAQRRAWRDKIGGCWKWSQALPDLLALWEAHGTGLVAKHSILHFQDGALTAPSQAAELPYASHPFVKSSSFPEVLEDILQGLGSGDASILEYGIRDTSHIYPYDDVWEELTQRAIPNGVRVVLVPESGISEKAMDTLGRALGQHPRVLFFAVHICVGDHSKPGVLKDCNAAEARVCAGLSSWPLNAAFYALDARPDVKC